MYAKNTLVEFAGEVSSLTGRQVHAPGRAVVVKSRSNDRGWVEYVVRFECGKRQVVMPNAIRALSVAEFLPKV